eukprot:EW704460.1.p2 GENE.EW704460.1~~EW704460.1.p2  ORF type:complete len:108 (+),score=44.04 EW704460.1:54-377(+)
MADKKDAKVPKAEKSQELYFPRKCSATNRLIPANDHASVQFNIGVLNANGVYAGTFEPVAFSGFIRSQGASDFFLNRIAAEKGLMKNLFRMAGADKFKTVKVANDQE